MDNTVTAHSEPEVYNDGAQSEPQSYNVKQMADLVGVSEGLIRIDAKKFKIPSWKLQTGERHFGREMVGVFAQIKAFKEQGLSAENIAINIARALKAEQERVREQVPEALGVDMAAIVDAVADRMRGEITGHDEAFRRQLFDMLTNLYGAGQQEIGYWKSQAETFRGQAQAQALQLQEAQRATLLLPERSASLEKLERDQAAHAAELEESRKAFHKLELEHQALGSQLEQARREREHAERQASDTRAQLTSSSKREAEQAAELLKARELIEAQALELAKLRDELEAERTKGFFGRRKKAEKK